jgi:glycosyltransferase involved in cell wall biosynthesis
MNENSNDRQRLRLCRVVTVPITFSTLLREQLKVISDNGIQVTLVSSPGEELSSIMGQLYPMRCYPIMMSRAIDPGQDMVSLFRLARFFRLQKFDIVHSSTPKAGLLTALAAWLNRVPIRLHTYTGQPWVEMRGWQRRVARWSDRIIGMLSTQCYADSHSQRDFLVREGLIRDSKIAVLAAGSISGVDLERFNPVTRQNDRAIVRRELQIDDDALVILFVGRLTRDKGIIELVSVFASIDLTDQKTELVLVGPFEPERDPLPQPILDQLSNHPRIHVVGFSRQPERYMAIADVFCLPSYREGFGTVIIEAAAMGVPAVATSIVGLIDAVAANETGLLVKSKDVQGLREALEVMLRDGEMRTRLGQLARERAQALFNSTVVNQAVADEYFRLAKPQ